MSSASTTEAKERGPAGRSSSPHIHHRACHMRCSRPLATTHPELLVVKGRGYTEYRVYNSYLARDGSGRTVKRYTGWTWTDALVVALVAMAWPQVSICVLSSIFRD
jgi:hypothetical protein